MSPRRPAGDPGTRQHGPARAASALGGLLRAGTALACLAGSALGPMAPQALAQAAADTAAPEADTSIFNRRTRGAFGQTAGRNGLPALRGSGPGGEPVLGGTPGTAGESSGGESVVGLSGGGEGLSRLPRFRTGIPSLAGASPSGASTQQRQQGLIQQRKAPPRRFLFPTRPITRQRTQDFVTDLRLTPTIRNPVSGVPAPTPPPQPLPLPGAIPLTSLSNPGAILLGDALTRRPEDADPAYAPLGLRLGGLTLLPAVTQGIGYDSNPNQLDRGIAKSSLALRTEGELAIRSDWSAAELTGEMRGGYSAYPDYEAADRPNGLGASRLRVEVNRDTALELEGRFFLDSQRIGSPELQGAVSGARPLIASYGTSAGVTQNFNRLQVSLRGSVDRSIFEDAPDENGRSLGLDERNSNDYAARLRVGYEITPAITPFVDTLVDTRVYDTRVDQYGLRRDSDGIGVTAGVSVRLDRRLTGEVSAGMQRRTYDDPSLRSIDAPLVNAALVWSMSPLTTVRVAQQTGFIETSIAGSSGVYTDVASLEVQHDLLRNLSLTAGGAYLNSRYQGVGIKEEGWSALARADYRLNRWLTLRGSYLYSQLSSVYPQVNAPTQYTRYDQHLVMFGLRVNP